VVKDRDTVESVRSQELELKPSAEKRERHEAWFRKFTKLGRSGLEATPAFLALKQIPGRLGRRPCKNVKNASHLNEK